MMIDARTSLYAVIGHPVGHSLSPVIHNFLFRKYDINAVYLAFDILPADLKKFFHAMRFLPIKGCNITLPHKTSALGCLDRVDKTAQDISAVNTVVNKNGKLVGYNTDIYGIEKSLEAIKINISETRFLVLGAGGASRAVLYCLAKNNAPVIYLANRTYSKALNLKNLITKSFPGLGIKTLPLNKTHLGKVMKDVDCIINATSLGIKPEDPSPVPGELLRKRHKIFDLTYNPEMPSLVRIARDKGCRAVDGLAMLIWQGLKAFHLWTGIEPDFDSVYKKVKQVTK